MTKNEKFIARYGDPKDIDKNLDNTDVDVRVAALQNLNATSEHINKGLNDKD